MAERQFLLPIVTYAEAAVPKRALTDIACKRIKPPASGQVDHFDKGYPGLALRVSHGGHRTWVYFYRLNGKQRRFSLGFYTEDDEAQPPALTLKKAREAWRTAREHVLGGIDPAGVKAKTKKREPVTVRKLGETFIAWREIQKRNRTAGEVARMFELHLYPVIGDREVRTIDEDDLQDVIDRADERDLSGARLNRIHANVRRLFNWAWTKWSEKRTLRGIPNPAADWPRPFDEETARKRKLDDDELFAFIRACRRLGNPFGDLFLLLLYSGQRRSEVGAAPWAEFSLGDAMLWSLPGERTKNAVDHVVPLSTQTAELLQRLPSRGKRDLLFPAEFSRIKPAEGQEPADRPVSGFSQAKKRLDARMLRTLKALARKRSTDPRKVELPPWRLHDLRRTAASGMQRLGIAVHVTEKALNHISGTLSGIAGVYQVFDYLDERRSALQAWANYLDGLMEERPSNVVGLREAR